MINTDTLGMKTTVVGLLTILLMTLTGCQVPEDQCKGNYPGVCPPGLVQSGWDQ